VAFDAADCEQKIIIISKSGHEFPSIAGAATASRPATQPASAHAATDAVTLSAKRGHWRPGPFARTRHHVPPNGKGRH
jgi:hypothetical protein